MYVTVDLLTFYCFCLILDVSISYFPYVLIDSSRHQIDDRKVIPVRMWGNLRWHDLWRLTEGLKRWLRKQAVCSTPGAWWCLKTLPKNRTLFFCKPWKQKNRTKSPSASQQRTKQPFPAFSSAGAKARASFCASQHAESTPHQTELI